MVYPHYEQQRYNKPNPPIGELKTEPQDYENQAFIINERLKKKVVNLGKSTIVVRVI